MFVYAIDDADQHFQSLVSESSGNSVCHELFDEDDSNEGTWSDTLPDTLHSTYQENSVGYADTVTSHESCAQKSSGTGRKVYRKRCRVAKHSKRSKWSTPLYKYHCYLCNKGFSKRSQREFHLLYCFAQYNEVPLPSIRSDGQNVVLWRWHVDPHQDKVNSVTHNTQEKS